MFSNVSHVKDHNHEQLTILHFQVSKLGDSSVISFSESLYDQHLSEAEQISLGIRCGTWQSGGLRPVEVTPVSTISPQ